MGTCVRGFSFMPENKVEATNLKYVEGNDLERTWKATRRERLKHQEEKIWEEFVKDQDIVRSMCKDDPYQFVDQLPQKCIRQLLDYELQKIKQEKITESEQVEPQVEEEPADNQHMTFVEESQRDIILHMFDEDRDDDDDVCGPEEEMLNESMSPPLTVREREVPSPDRTSTEGKSSDDNITKMIEGSIYCTKVKELRMKMIKEMNNIVLFLGHVDRLNLEPDDVTRTMRRAAEFSARYGRVNLYQIHRQISDIERHNDKAPAYAVRTHLQSQLCRIYSLHNNLLQALQVFRRSLPQTLCIRECRSSLSSLASLVCRTSCVCVCVCSRVRPSSLPAAERLCADAVQETCDKLVKTLNEYTAKMTDYLSSTDNTFESRNSTKRSGKKPTTGNWSRFGKSIISNTDTRLSMYSLDTRHTFNKSSSSKEHSGGTSKKNSSIIVRTRGTVENSEVLTKFPKKSPRHGRPLMRGPTSRTTRTQQPRDHDIRTLVEAVPCSLSAMSREVSRPPSPWKCGTPRKDSRDSTPRKEKVIRKSPTGGPRSRTQSRSPQLDTNKRREAFRNPNERSKTVESFRMIEIESSRNTQRSPVKDLKDTRDKVQMKEEDKQTPEANVETENITETKDMGNEKIKKEKDKNRSSERHTSQGSCEVTKLLHQLCGGDAAGRRSEKVFGAKNAQLLCVNGGGGSPRPPSTPQLLKILEETIQKKTPKILFPKTRPSSRDLERYRMAFNIPERVTEDLFDYRTKFVQHMLSSALYANSAVGKPWEKIGRVSDQIIDELLLDCAKEMELQAFVEDLYKSEIC